MPYEIKVEDSDRIVIAQVSGSATGDDHYGALENAIEACKKKGYHRLLVDLRELSTEGVTSTMGIYRFGEQLAKDKRFKGVAVAHVLPKCDKTQNDIKFASTVAANRGGLTGEFSTVEEAKQWLAG